MGIRCSFNDHNDDSHHIGDKDDGDFRHDGDGNNNGDDEDESNGR